MKNPLKLWLGTLTVFLLALTPAVVPVGGSVAPASAETAGSGTCAQTVSNNSSVDVAQSGDHCVIQFKRVGTTTWTVPSAVADVDFLVVGGGGGGAARNGGGGGGGTVVEANSQGVTGGSSVSVVVGDGGDGGPENYSTTTQRRGTDGSPSSVTISGTTTQAAGGSRAGSGSGDSLVINGGSSGEYSGGIGAESACWNGLSTDWCGGGGAGAGGDGGDAVTGSSGQGGNGGAGVASSLAGIETYYGGGGGGGVDAGVTRGLGGNGGGGNGGAGGAGAGENGAANTGGGGGGGGYCNSGGSCTAGSAAGGNGGSGVVVLRYSLTPDNPTGLSISSGDGLATISYTDPTHSGASITDYEYQYRSYSGSAWGGWSAWQSLGETDGTSPITLTNGVFYDVNLRAVNSAGFRSPGANVGTVIPSVVGEILRLDATHPESFESGDSTWVDLAEDFDGTPTNGVAFNSRTKSFDFDGSDDYFDLPNVTTDFSQGLAIHVVADLTVLPTDGSDSSRNFERFVDFGNGAPEANIWFGRSWRSNDIAFETFSGGVGTSSGYCRTKGNTGIIAGVHTYSVVISPTGGCSLYRDGSQLDAYTTTNADYDANPTTRAESATTYLPSVAIRKNNFVGKSNWPDAFFAGSIQSVIIYNTDQVVPTCHPIESTFTGDGSIGEDSVPYKALSFTTGGSCSWEFPTDVEDVTYLVVGGGGGGGGATSNEHPAGGGGAGGVLQGTLTGQSGSVEVKVGLGGVGGTVTSSSPYNGSRGESGLSSEFGSSIEAFGGGAGGAYDNGIVDDHPPLSGGSGGGGGASAILANRTGANGTAGQGFGGGDVTQTGTNGRHGAGGGGAGGAGGDTTDNGVITTAAGAGGVGIDSSISGALIAYAAGGAGGTSDTSPEGLSGESGLGEGGEGGGTHSSTDVAANGGSGGSGIVVVRYSLGPAAPAISSVSSGDGSIDVAFTAPSHTGGAAITDYEYSFDGSTWTSLGTDSAGTETISGLTNGTAYTPRIRAVNGNGNGVPVTAGSATTPRGSQTLSWSPTNTTVEVTDGSVTLAPAASALGGVTIEYSVQTAGDPSCAVADDATPTVTFSATGTCVIRATALEGGAYLAATTDVTLTVTTAAQTITFAAVSDKTYGDSSFSLTVSASSSLTVTVTPADTSVCTVSGATVSIVSAGTCSLVASQSGDSDYAAASTVTRSFTISPKAITMSVSIADKNYDGLSSATVSGTPTLSGVVSGDANYVAVDTAEITAAFADPDAGAGKSVSVTLGDDVLAAGSSGDRSDSYTVTLASTPTATISKISQATLSLTSASSMVFGQSIPLVATGGSGSGALSYSKVSGPCTVSGSTVTSTGAGSCVVTATRAADTNYNAVTSSNFTITVAKANQSINFTSSVPVSAVSGTTYTPAATATSGLTPSFSITTGNGTVCSLSSGVVTFLTSGTCVITAAQSGDSDYNAASSVTQTIVAGKINQTISFPAISGKDFDDPAFSAGATVSSGRTVTYATSTGSVCAVNASSGVVSIKTVGDCTVTASSAGDASYAAASDVSRTFTISPVVAGKPSITSVSFGDSSVTVAFGAPGFVGGDAIDGYQVVATSSGGSVTKPDCSTTSPCAITGLTNGESYTLTVAAINASGVGSASDASPSITPARIADAVSGLATTPGDEQLAVSWTALTDAQLTAAGGTFTRYDVYLRVNGGAWGSAVTPDGTNNLATRTTTSYTFTGLTNGTAYDVKVVAITNANSTELSSNTSTALGVPATTPAAVSGLTATALSNTTALASWSAPVDDGGSVVTAYSVNLSCTFVNATDTFCELSGLTAGSTVTVSVGGTNLMGTGSTVSVSITMPGGSSGSSGGGSSGGGETVTAAPTPATNLPVVSPRRVIVPLQPTPRPRPFAAPVRIVPERGFDPDAGAKARIGGQPATVTKKPLDEGGLSVEAGAFQLGITLATPPTVGVSGERENTDISVPTGQSTKVSGGGLLPGSSLQVWLPGMTGESPKELARIPVRTDGTFDSELSFTARQSETPIPIGRQVMQVTGFDEDGNQTVVDMVVNIGQGAPAPEPNKTANELPDLSPGQSLATSAGTPETVTVEAAPQTGEVAVLSEEWAFTVAVAEDSGVVEQADAGATITMVQTKTATVSGEGFQPDTRVDIWLFSDPTLLGSVIVSADGSFTGEVYMDVRYATPGEHTLQLQGVANDGFIKAANLGVVVQEPVDFTSDSAGGLVLWVIVVALAVALVVVVLVLLLGRRRHLRS